MVHATMQVALKIAWISLCSLLLIMNGIKAQQGQQKPCLNLDAPKCAIDDWWTSVPGYRGKQRIWDTRLLDVGINYQGHLSRFHNFYQKLRSGKPIVTMAYGSSFVLDAAGCWQTSVQALWDLGIVPNPTLYPHPNVHVLTKWDPSWLEGRCSSSGYMDALMEQVNASYPNPKHIFINNGRGGGSLQMIVEASCISAHAPEHVDLVLLDTVTNHAPWQAGEKLLRSLLKGPGSPIVVMVSNSHHCLRPQYMAPELSTRCGLDCLLKGKGSRSYPGCHGLPETYTKGEYDFWHESIAPYQKLAQHYDVAHLNMHDIMHSIMNSGLNSTLNLNAFELLSRFYQDTVHLRKSDLGVMLVADLVLHWMMKGLDALREGAAAGRPPPPPASSLPLPPPLAPESTTWYKTRCYGMALKDLEGKTDIREVHGRAWSDMLGAPSQSNLFQQLPALQVTKSEGWELQIYYQGKRHKQIKPGWITNTPGALLQFKVNSTFPEATPAAGSSDGGGAVEVLLLYTVSYDGWGQARVSCISHCTCMEHILDAANKEKSSLHRHHRIEVTPHEQCTMQLEVLQSSSSGGHKFKLTSVMVRVKVAEKV